LDNTDSRPIQHINSVTTITEVSGDGQQLTAVARIIPRGRGDAEGTGRAVRPRYDGGAERIGQTGHGIGQIDAAEALVGEAAAVCVDHDTGLLPRVDVESGDRTARVAYCSSLTGRTSGRSAGFSSFENAASVDTDTQMPKGLFA
jgi:hypothetical protein